MNKHKNHKKTKLKSINFTIISLFLSSILITNNLPIVYGLGTVDLAISPMGYSKESATYTYDQYVNMLASNGVEQSDFMLIHEPEDMMTFAYFKGDILIYIEIFEFQNTQQAIEEYEAQRDDTDGSNKLYNGPIFQRFISRDRIFQHQNYIALVSFDPYNDVEAMDAASQLFEEFIQKMVETISSETSSPPADNGDIAQWGIKVGDKISWEIDDDTYAGTIMSGGRSSSANWEPEIEIIEISPSGHAVLVKE
jgi:hypothetical protein